MAVLDSPSSSVTNNLVDTITPTPTKPMPYRIPARRALDKENVKPPVVTEHGHKSQKVSKYVNFPEFADALARSRRVQEYMKTKKGGGTKEVDDLTVKINRLGPNPKVVSNKENKVVDLTVKNRLGPKQVVSNKEFEECFAGFTFPNSPDPSALPMPMSLIKKTMGAQLIMV